MAENDCITWETAFNSWGSTYESSLKSNNLNLFETDCQNKSHFCLLYVHSACYGYGQSDFLIFLLCHFLVFPSGSPLSVVIISAADGASSRMQFVDYWPVPADGCQTFPAADVHLLVMCKSGAIHTVTTGRGTQPCTMLLAERLPDWLTLLLNCICKFCEQKHEHIIDVFATGQKTVVISQLS